VTERRQGRPFVDPMEDRSGTPLPFVVPIPMAFRDKIKTSQGRIEAWAFKNRYIIGFPEVRTLNFLLFARQEAADAFKEKFLT
jgi:hypothetical protein